MILETSILEINKELTPLKDLLSCSMGIANSSLDASVDTSVKDSVSVFIRFFIWSCVDDAIAAFINKIIEEDLNDE